MLPLHPALRLSLLAAALVAANLVHAEVPAGAPFTPEQQHVIQQLSAREVRAAAPKIASEAVAEAARALEGEKRSLDIAKDALEVGRKSVDWWLSNIGMLMAILGAVLAAASIGIPYVMGLKRKAEWEEKLEQLTLKLQEAEAAQQKAETAQQQAEQHAQEIEVLLALARDKTSLIPKADEITGQLSTDVLEKLNREKPPQVVNLIEQAWAAYKVKDWETAKPLWELLSLIEGHDSNVWFNLGFSMQHLSKDWEQIACCYQRSHLLEPDVSALNNWGVALGDWAETLSGDRQLQLFAEAISKYVDAARMQPSEINTYFNWGATLSKWGKALPGEHRAQYFAEACNKFIEVTRMQSDNYVAYDAWCSTLLDWARYLTGASREEKLLEAESIFLKAKAVGNKNPYNFACIRAQQGRFDESRELLRETRNSGYLPGYEKLNTDPDFDNLRGLDWFQQLLEDVRQQEAAQASQPA